MTSYRPTANGQTLQLVRGDFHRHTELSFDGGNDGPLNDAYRYSIDAASLNWAGCCDHDDGGAREYSWWMDQKYTDAYLMATRFMPMYYYERSVGYPEGHRNIMFAHARHPAAAAPAQRRCGFAPFPLRTPICCTQTCDGTAGVTASHTSGTTSARTGATTIPKWRPRWRSTRAIGRVTKCRALRGAVSADDSIAGYREKGFVSNALAWGTSSAFEASSDHVSTHLSFTQPMGH